MLTRRAVLLCAAAAGLGVAQSGCTAPPPIVLTLPWVPPAPLPIAGVGTALESWTELAGLAGQLVSNATAWQLTADQLSSAQWLADACDRHRAVL
ncbi:MAG: hypothetical protein WAS07_08385, partial [Micropruina sp.]